MCIIRKRRHSYREYSLFLVISIFYMLGPPIVRAQEALGARELAMGQSTTALPDSPWSVFSNPAMLSAEHAGVSFYGVRYYGLSEISDIAASIVYPTEIGVLAAGAHRYGFDLFSESRLRIGYKNAVAGFHYGIIFNYSHVKQGGGYGSAGAFGIDLGLAAPILPDLWLGAKATNINRPTYGSRNEEELPRSLSIGLCYRLSDIALFSTEVLKDVRFPLSYRGGIEVTVIGGLVTRAGITTAPQTFSAGFGYAGPFWGANVAVQRHENSVLGYSPAIDFYIIW